jgi:hypothetical protein
VLSETLNLRNRLVPALIDDRTTLEGRVTLEAAERFLLDAFEAGGDDDGSLLFDLRKADYVEASVLLLTVAVLAARVRSDRTMTLRLPEERRLRDFLRVWNFQDVVEAACAVRLRDIVHADDTQYFGEGGEPLEPRLHSSSGPTTLLRLLEQDGFFACRSYRLGDEAAETTMVRQEWSRWRDASVVDLFRHFLSGDPHELSRVIVTELTANAVEHPHARVACVTAAVEEPADADEHSWLSLAVWDDGDSIIDTLRDAVDDHTIRLARLLPPDRFRLKPVGWATERTGLDSDWTPQAGAHPAEFLIASLLPGITCKLPGSSYARRPEERDHVGLGIGLYAVYRSAIDSFGGVIEVRTGAYRLRVSRGAGRGRYELELEAYEEPYALLGNLVTVKLPYSARAGV